MNVEPRTDLAKRKARLVLEELEIATLQQLQDVEKVCLGRGVFVRAEPLRNFEGLLVRPRRMIVYRADIAEPGRKRFTIAHELGHWEMHPHLNQIEASTVGDIHGYKGSAAELEANAFAAELLMPEFLLTQELRFASPTLDTVNRLSARFNMSLTASAVRLADHSKLPVFVAFSSNNRLKWYARSSTAGQYFFKSIGSDLDGDSLARTCLAQPDDRSEPVEVPTEAWFPDDFHRNRFKVWEESVELGDYGVTLSILTVDE